MKLFQLRELQAARDFAAAGGQALHLMPADFVAGVASARKSPSCFRGGREAAHLFDQDEVRLRATARRLGVKVLQVEKAGTPSQHIDLVGGPLNRAKGECDR